MTRHVAAAALALGACSVFACSSGADGAGNGPPSSPSGDDAGPATFDAAADARGGDAVAPDAGPPPTEQAGSRLSPLYFKMQTSDGASQRWFAGWHDSARNEGCYPRRLSDGKLHCVPYARSVEFDPADTYFLDAQCTTPIAGLRKAGPSCPGRGDALNSDKYVTRLDQNPQCSTMRLYAAPTTSPIVPSTVYTKSGSNCTGQSGSYLSSNWDLYPKSTLAGLAEIASSSFVEMTTNEESSVYPNDRVTAGTRIHPVIVKTKGADGSYSRSLSNYLDSARTEFCYPGTLLSDGKTHCAPRGSWFYDESYFLDPSCTSPAIEIDNRQASECERDDRNGKYLLSRDQVGACGVNHFFQFPSQSSYSEVYSKYGNQCSDNGPVSSEYLFIPKTPLTEVAPSSFLEFTMSYTAGATPNGVAGAKLTPVSLTYAGADGFSSSVDIGQFQDVQSHTVCSQALLSDGQLHCVPTYASVQIDSDANYFADAACTQPVIGVTKSAPCGFPLPGPTLMAKSLQVNGCSGLKLLPIPTTAIAPAALYYKNGQTCAQDASNGPHYLRSYDFYPASATQAPNVDPSTFPTMTMGTSP